MKVLIAQSCLTLYDPMDCSSPDYSLSVGFSRQEYWSGLPFPSPGYLPNPSLLHLLHWQEDSLPLSYLRIPCD